MASKTNHTSYVDTVNIGSIINAWTKPILEVLILVDLKNDCQAQVQLKIQVQNPRPESKIQSPEERA